MRISLVIPTYNEKENIKRLIEFLYRIKEDLEIIVVDDNSPDGTGLIVDKLRKQFRSLRVIHRYNKKGLGTAIIDGLKAAKTDVVGVMDADFSHPPEVLRSVIKCFEKEVDFVVCSRYIKGGSIEGWSLIRKVTSRGAILLSKPLTSVRDPVSGFFFVKRSVLDGVDFSSRGSKSWKICLEILVKGKYRNVVEVPYKFHNRRVGKSKLDLKEYYNYFMQVLSLFIYKISLLFDNYE